jgi:hypothetical protein
MTPWSEETKLLVLGLIVAVVVAGSAFTVTKLLAAGADHEKAAVAAATAQAQHAADIQTATWAGRATAAETAQGAEHASIDALRAGLSALKLPVSAPATRLPASPAAPASAGAPAAPVVRQVVVCEASNDLRSDYGEALRADGVAADERALYNAWPSVSPPH